MLVPQAFEKVDRVPPEACFRSGLCVLEPSFELDESVARATRGFDTVSILVQYRGD